MKRLQFLIAAGSALILVYSCRNRSEDTKALIDRQCGRCHMVPGPELLDKSTWRNGVMPEMAFRMGLNTGDYKLRIPPADSAAVYGTLPSEPMITEDEMKAIRDFYEENAPDSLSRPATAVDNSLTLFHEASVTIPGTGAPFISLLSMDTIRDKIYVGTLSNKIYRFGKGLAIEDFFDVDSPPSEVSFGRNGTLVLSLMGILQPNEQAKGEIVSVTNKGTVTAIIDSLQRPVYFQAADLNSDHLDDYIICDFGNYTGALVVYENLGNSHYKPHTIYGVPGARKVTVLDADRDGKQDILALMTQGNEQLLLFTNEGDFNFSAKPLLRFPPVYGSSYFELQDFNNDGTFDILFTNGDNGDFSNILKPYHGVRIFLNDGKNNFSQSWFFPMFGASKAVARDFDQDGDLDIAAISFFPDFKRHPEQGFLYFENIGGNFAAHSIPRATEGRWLVMNAADVDGDGDSDLLLGAFDTDFGVPPGLLNIWSEKKISLLVLLNQRRH